jgi:hypothetical protein
MAESIVPHPDAGTHGRLPPVDAVTFTTAAPIIPVLDLDAALERYRRLGFTAVAYAGEDRYGFVDRGPISMHLTEWSEHDPLSTASAVYFYVSDADALYDEWRAAGVDGHLSPPEDTDYRLREFAYVDPDGTLHRVGSPLAV